MAALLLLGATAMLFTLAPAATGAEMTGGTAGLVYLGQTIPDESGPVAVFGFGARDPAGTGSLTNVNVTITDDGGFTFSDLLPLGTDADTSGVGLYKDKRTAGVNDALDSADEPVTLASINKVGSAVEMTLSGELLPLFIFGSFDWFVVVRTSDTIGDDDRFHLTVPANNISLSGGKNQPASDVSCGTLTADVVGAVDIVPPGGGFFGPQGTSGNTVGMLGIHMTDGGAGELLENITVNVVDSGALNFAWSDLRTLDTRSAISGIGLYVDDGDDEDAFDRSDTPQDMTSFATNGNSFTMRFNGIHVPDDPEGEFEFIIVARASATISDGDDIKLAVPMDGITFSDHFSVHHERVGTLVSSGEVEADTLPPDITSLYWEESSAFLDVGGTGRLEFGDAMAGWEYATVRGACSDPGGGSGVDRVEYSSETTVDDPDPVDYTPGSWDSQYGFNSVSQDAGSPITVTVFDNVGNWVQGNLQYNREIADPAVSLDDPSTPGQVIKGSFKVNATASDPSGMASVEFSADGGNSWTSMAVNVGNPNRYTGDWDTQLEDDGPYSLIVRGTDNVGDSGVDSVLVLVDNNPISSLITQPDDGDYLVGTETFRVRSNNGALKCELFVDGTLEGVDTTMTGVEFIIDLDTTQFTDIMHTFQAVTYNAFDVTATDLISCFVDNDPPSVSAVTAHLPSGQGAVKNGDHVRITAKVTENGSGLEEVLCDISAISDLTIENMYDDGNHGDGSIGDGVFGTDIIKINATWSYHQVTVSATDMAGNLGQGSVMVPVDTMDPLITDVYVDYPVAQTATKQGDEIRIMANATESGVGVYATLMLDTSGSMGGQDFIDLQNAAKSFVAGMSQNDYLAIYVYGSINITERILNFTRMTPQNKDTAYDLIDDEEANTGTPVWDCMGDAIDYTIMNSKGIPVVIAITDGADDTFIIPARLYETGSYRYCPWHQWGVTKYYQEHYGKYTESGVNFWITNSINDGLGENRSGLLFAPIPVFTIGLGLEHHDPPNQPVDPVKHTDPNGFEDDTYAYYDDESGTTEYNLWRIAETSTGGAYFHAPTSADLEDIYDSVTIIINKLNAPKGIYQVYSDISNLGGSNQIPLFDDGEHGDLAAGDGIWGSELTPVESVATGVVDITATAYDFALNQRTIFGTAELDNLKPVMENLTANYTADKIFADDGDSIHLFATISDLGSGIRSAWIDASPAGGPTAVDLLDDGGGYDLEAGDGIFTSSNFTVASGDETGSVAVQFSTTDYAANLVTQKMNLVVANDDGPPMVELVAPGTGSFMQGVYTIRVSAADKSGIHNVTARINPANASANITKVNLVPNEVSGYYEGALATGNFLDGQYHMDARAVDSLFQSSATLKIIVYIDNADPALELLYPQDGDIIGGEVKLDVKVTDTHLESAMYRLGSGAWVSVDEKLDTTGYPDGFYTFTARAIDTSGRVSEISIGVTVDNTVPYLVVVAPIPGQVIKGDLYCYLEVLDTGGVKNVTVKVQNDTYPAIFDDGSGYYKSVIDLSIYPNGELKFKAVARDVAGHKQAFGPFLIINNFNDRDGDGVPDHLDAFPDDPLEWADSDGDGVGNNADLDDDNDGYPDAVDAFPEDPEEWLDTDGDGIGDNADTDDDGDGIPDNFDDRPKDPFEYRDSDGDGLGDEEDDDDDNDNVSDRADAFPNDPAEQYDHDGDGIGNNADKDDDGDGVADSKDAFPTLPGEWEDSDGDGIGDLTDNDDDGDGIPDTMDAFPRDPAAWRDTDGDGLPDTLGNGTTTGLTEDDDDDGDGVRDDKDDFPTDPDEWKDTDGDGIGNNADKDDDGDGVSDVHDHYPLDDTRSGSRALEDWGMFFLAAAVLVAALLMIYSGRFGKGDDRSGRKGGKDRPGTGWWSGGSGRPRPDDDYYVEREDDDRAKGDRRERRRGSRGRGRGDDGWGDDGDRGRGRQNDGWGEDGDRGRGRRDDGWGDESDRGRGSGTSGSTGRDRRMSEREMSGGRGDDRGRGQRRRSRESDEGGRGGRSRDGGRRRRGRKVPLAKSEVPWDDEGAQEEIDWD